MTSNNRTPHVAIIGGGFCGLASGYELTKQGIQVTILERDREIGGLAGSFQVNGVRLEKFYHHWFTNDEHVMGLIEELGTQDQVVLRSTRTGLYYANNFFRLSSPLDVLRFTPLPISDRFRLGLLALRARRVKDWKRLENLTAEEWLRQMGGDKVYEVVWEPLLRGKFGEYASQVSAVWFWNKLKLRGGSRGKGGNEQLAYYKGGFAALADELASRITSAGGKILTNTPVYALSVGKNGVTGLDTANQHIEADAVIATPALPIIADLLESHVSPEYLATLRSIKYLANVCLVLELDRSLSDIYWLNVNDPDFPFVGVIEHTNFEPSSTYHGKHIVYLSKYLPDSADLFSMEDNDLLDFTVPYLKRMFPAFRASWITNSYVWKAHYSQAVVQPHFSTIVPAADTPLFNFFIATMAQIYPEDRGTNYAIRQGHQITKLVTNHLSSSH